LQLPVPHCQVNKDYAHVLREDHESSYLSNRARSVFFRELSVAYPELLDLMCSADDDAMSQVQQAIRFICSSIEAANERPSNHQPLYTAVHEWLVGPIIELLSFEDNSDRRKALSKLLTKLCPTFRRSDSVSFTGVIRKSSLLATRRLSRVKVGHDPPSAASEPEQTSDDSQPATLPGGGRETAAREWAVYSADKLNDTLQLEDADEARHL
jgi:hypothetical protein